MGKKPKTHRWNKLSTPHGTLGTERKYRYCGRLDRAFNSTRYIRNSEQAKQNAKLGASFNSTRYIRNESVIDLTLSDEEELSTPHGTLGTSKGFHFPAESAAFQLHTVH